MRKLSLLSSASVLALAACGDGSSKQAQPDAPEMPVDAAIDPFSPGCYQVEQTSNDMFSKPEDFGDWTPGTLAGWNPDGRWFLTGTRVGGVSSFHFQKRTSDIVVDRDTNFPGTIDDDKIFQRGTFVSGQGTVIIAKRVTNRLGDGSLRA